ncbi:unnamed protein product [Macrosiphum euphorbiae]|uniref:Uncharacterized protein n=1 Tax=Macrosiphum euphorbiae TaxID=13131 RepID=A0AAV0WVD9_9HEMI|nr:unnamed protein product [Macrosiphum euphorbiae]
MIVKDESSHSHENETESVRNKKLFSNQLKRKCEDELERPSKIINTEIQKSPEQAKLFNGNEKSEDYNHRKRRFPTRCRLYLQYIILLYNYEFEIALFM